ncbi:hypothetical protein IV38_GL001917 [Lactobacillus selangorensis]|uniref:Uncharacterized protein n=1 Tax=Lactobacillus selangorensis TaxID=81857 RepID=A0A0R2FRS3_9LACO|nr:hypothetical protein [Lactobacillus selangorensis]KRN27704.1 hypothetical protein IV38_GL001917 [Lactobacillus selangorensis]KRN30331.1 hypothetical protein IV40_GL001920 [Lactobacillus selangorensis]
MTKEELTTFICSTYWQVFFLWDGSDKIGDLEIGHAKLWIKFEKDGRFTFPTPIDFIPGEFGSWAFTPAMDGIAVTGNDGQVDMILNLPERRNGGQFEMKYRGVKRFLLGMPEISPNIQAYNVPMPPLDAIDLQFILRHEDDQAIRKQAWKQGSAVRLVDDSDSLYAQLQACFDYLINHAHLKKIALTMQLLPANWGDSIREKKMTTAVTNDFFWIAGDRGTMIEFLSAAFIELNKEQVAQEKVTVTVADLQHLLAVTFGEKQRLVKR